jgi:hypothetical protein
MARSPLTRISPNVRALTKSMESEVKLWGQQPVPVVITIGQGKNAVKLLTTVNDLTAEIVRLTA